MKRLLWSVILVGLVALLTPALVLAREDASPSSAAEHWVLVNVAKGQAMAMEGNQVVRVASVTVGTPRWPTPRGTFTISRRVLNETMDSATIGIPRSSPSGYYLKNVYYTQYFYGGVALHYNYWSPASAFGSAAGSHGCVGMKLDDARFFWNFATYGTRVVVR